MNCEDDKLPSAEISMVCFFNSMTSANGARHSLPPSNRHKTAEDLDIIIRICLIIVEWALPSKHDAYLTHCSKVRSMLPGRTSWQPNRTPLSPFESALRTKYDFRVLQVHKSDHSDVCYLFRTDGNPFYVELRLFPGSQ